VWCGSVALGVCSIEGWEWSLSEKCTPARRRHTLPGPLLLLSDWFGAQAVQAFGNPAAGSTFSLQDRILHLET
jgi:hypothetical protein